jgi:hypothetical protein
LSKIALSGDPSGTGTFTIASPNSNSNFTLTLPAATGTVLTTASAGSVLQVVQGTTTTEVTSTSSSYIDTGLTATITPTSASSKILVIVTHGEIAKDANAGARLAMRLVRSSTTISQFASGLLYTNSAIQNRCSASITYLDSPATTSATTYKTTAANPDASGSVNIQNNSSMSTITLLEIAA